MEKEIIEQSDVLSGCDKYNHKTLLKLAEQINANKINKVIMSARGSSDNAAEYFKYAFESLTGIVVSHAAPSIATLYGKSLDLSNTMVIGVSQSGMAADVAAVLENANKSGAISVAITNNLNSHMAKMAKYSLYCNAGEELSVAATKTFTSQMYLLGKLAAYVSGNKDINEMLMALPENIKKIISIKENIRILAKEYKDSTELIVLARGMNYSIAKETALKIQETTYINARAYAASDFHHGPFAIVDKKTRALLLAPSGESQNDMIMLKEKLLNAGARVFVITDDEKIAASAQDKIIIPVGGSDYITPFYNVVVAQLLACYISEAKGLNPDAPRGLKKVTITK